MTRRTKDTLTTDEVDTPEWEEVEIDLFPDWTEAIPGGLGMAAMMGNERAREVCALIEKAWNLGFKAGAKGGEE